MHQLLEEVIGQSKISVLFVLYDVMECWKMTYLPNSSVSLLGHILDGVLLNLRWIRVEGIVRPDLICM